MPCSAGGGHQGSHEAGTIGPKSLVAWFRRGMSYEEKCFFFFFFFFCGGVLNCKDVFVGNVGGELDHCFEYFFWG